MKHTFSIIIPHKNIPNLLQRCLDSIPARDDSQIIIVDDNSDPNLVDFDHFPGCNRKDVELIFTKEGRGPGYARNIGLKHADGEKVLFADADDFFNYCIREILDEYKYDDSDIVFFNVSAINNKTYTIGGRGRNINNYHSLYKKEPEKALFLFRYDMGNPIAKLIRKSLIDTYSLQFDETRIHDDTRFSYLAGFHGKIFKVDDRAIYCITYRPESISYALDDEKILTRMHVLSQRDYFYLNNGINLDRIDVNLHIDSLVSLQKNGQKELFEKCVDACIEEGLSFNDIKARIKKSKKRKKIKHLKERLTYYFERIINRILQYA